MNDGKKKKGVLKEAASKKKKRGRPPVFSSEERDTVKGFDKIKSYRGATDLVYRSIAIFLLWKDPAFSWLADRKKMLADEPKSYKPSILTELGRLQDEEQIKDIALKLCKLKPKTKDAIIMIRRIRLGREAEGDYLKLIKSIEDALNRYIAARPSTPEEMAVRALRDLADYIETCTAEKKGA